MITHSRAKKCPKNRTCKLTHCLEKSGIADAWHHSILLLFLFEAKAEWTRMLPALAQQNGAALRHFD